jgi:hypothetical protein
MATEPPQGTSRAGRVYAHGLLRSGPSLGVRAAWRLIREDTPQPTKE